MSSRDLATSAPPSFVAWVRAREHALQRFVFLVSGDPQLTRPVLERALTSLHRQWRETADVVDLEVYARQEILHVLASLRAGEPSAARQPRDAPKELQPVWESCAALTLEQRAAVVLRYYEQRDVVEIAEVLGCTPDTADPLIQAGVSVVRERLDPGGVTMTDVEPLLRETLSEYAGRAPAEDDLADRVLEAFRRRRRRQVMLGVVAIALLLVPAAWLWRAETDSVSEAGGGIPLAEVPELRWESYGGIEVQVPAGWDYGDLTQWCAPEGQSGRVSGPAVDRPGIGPRVLCSANYETGNHGVDRPTYAAGLLLRPAGYGPRLGREDVAPGAEIFRRRVGDVDLTVVDVRPALAQLILNSATEVRDADLNGCATSAVIPRMGRYLTMRPGVDELTTADSVSVCYYETRDWPRPTLVRSEQLGAGQAQDLLERLQASASTDAQAPVDALGRCAESEAALYRFWSDGSTTDVWLHYAGCGPFGADDGRRPRESGKALLEPVFDSPWRGQLGSLPPGRDGG